MFEPYDYLKILASEHKEILHTDESNRRIFRISGIAGMEELLSNQTDISYPAVLVEVNDDGTFGDVSRSDNWLDNPTHVFFIVDRSQPGDNEALEASRKRTKRIGFEFLARMKRERFEAFRFADFSNINYQTIGPFGDSVIGFMITMRFNQPSDYFQYNPETWQKT